MADEEYYSPTGKKGSSDSGFYAPARDSGTPKAYRVKAEKAEGEVSSSTVNAENNQVKNVKMREEGQVRRGLSAVARGVVSFVAGSKNEKVTVQYVDKNGKVRSRTRLVNRSNLERAGRQLGSEKALRLQGGANHQNPLIQVGKQAPNQFLVHRPFTASGYRNMPPLRSRGVPITFRPSNFINSLNQPRRASPYDKYHRPLFRR